MRFSTKRKKRYSRASSDTQVESDTRVPNIRIKLQNGSFIAKGIGKGSKFNKWIRTSSEHTTYNTEEYHVGDIVVVNVADEQLATRTELAVIAACRGMDLHLVWLFRTNKTPEIKTLVGPDVASAYKLILSVYSDIASVECLVGHMPLSERKSVCIDWVLQLEPAKTICISTPRNSCFMRSLVERIKARELMDTAFPAPSGPLDSTPSQQDNGVQPEGEERKPTGRRQYQIILSPSPSEFAVSKRPVNDTQSAAERTTKKQKTDTLPDRSRATRESVPTECNSTLTAVESPPDDTTLLAEPESHPAQLEFPLEPDHHPSRDISDPVFRTDPSLLGSTEGFRTANDAASTAHPVVEASEALVSESDEKLRANAVRVLEGHNWLGEETIMPLIDLFMPNMGVRLVDIGEVPEQAAWEAWGTSRSKSIDLRAWDEIVLVPLFVPELQHWRLLCYSIVSDGAIVVTVYDSLKERCNLDSMEPAVRAIAKFLGYDLERPLRIESADEALQQNDSHNCGVLVVVHAIYIIARADRPQASSGNLWRFILRCCLQKKCTQEELAAEFSPTPPVQTSQPRRPGYHLLDCHATTHSRCERLRQAALHADEFCKVVHMIQHRVNEETERLQHRVNEETERLAFLNRLDEIGSHLSAMEHARLSLAFRNDFGFLEKMRGRSGTGKSESFVGLAQVALNIRVGIRAEFERSKQALDRVTEELRVAMVDADEWVKQARERIKDVGKVQEGAKTDMG